MGAIENFRAVDNSGSVDRWLDEQNKRLAGWDPGKPHPLEAEPMKKRQRQLLEWYRQEREKQAPNRYQMAVDQDFYDNEQWTEQDIQELAERGQAALTFNETATTVDWITGTEKRTRVDFKVLPRSDVGDQVQVADLKTKTLKYLGDVNKVGFARSLAFEDATKVGVGWLEDGARGDPTEEPVFSRYESWRNILWDSAGVERDGSDWRYLYRWKWVDLDVAIQMFPDREHQLRRAAVAANLWGSEEDEDFWYLGQHFQSRDSMGQVVGQRTYISDSSLVDNRRARVKLIEAWYRMPERCHVCRGEVFNGKRFDKENPDMVRAALEGAISLYDQLAMKVRVAIMTEGDLLQEMASPYKHNRFPFTPIWCYIRGRDRMPYGVIRRIRDPQEDLNKRMSKAQFLLSTNGIIADHDALDGTGLTWDDVREESGRPDYIITKKRGADFKIERHVELAESQLKLMDVAGRFINKAGGVTDENLGEQTNATSGRAIQARQMQGTVVTATIFDNDRYSIQLQGELQLSLAEQFITEPKVMRIAGARNKLDWVKINQPEVQADGSVRFINDITATEADFVVDQQDFHASVRQAMFESLSELVGRISSVNPEAGLRILRMALEFSDLPNKEEMASEIKNMLGIVDEQDLERMNPQQRQAYQDNLQAKQKAMQLQQATAEAELAEKQAKVQKLGAEAGKIGADAEKLRAEAQVLARGDGSDAGAQAAFDAKVRDIEQKAADAVDTARQEIEALHAKVNDRGHEIDTRAATDKEIAQIQADAKIEEAKIVNAFKADIDALSTQLKEATKELAGLRADQEKLARQADQERIAAKEREKVKAEAKPVEKEPKGPLVVFEKGAFEMGTPAAGKTVTAMIGGKKVTMRIEPDGVDKTKKKD